MMDKAVQITVGIIFLWIFLLLAFSGKIAKENPRFFEQLTGIPVQKLKNMDWGKFLREKNRERFYIRPAILAALLLTLLALKFLF